MTTQVAHGQLLDGLIAEVAALRADFSEYTVLFHLRHPLTLDDCLWQYITDRGSRDCSVGALGLICSFHRLYESFLMGSQVFVYYYMYSSRSTNMVLILW